MNEAYFSKFRSGIVGIDQDFVTPFGVQRLLYADWTASGRMYGPIEARFNQEIYPLSARIPARR